RIVAPRFGWRRDRLQQPVHLSDERLGVRRLLDEEVRAEFERLPGTLTGGAARNNHDGHARGGRASYVGDQRETVLDRHVQVEQNEIAPSVVDDIPLRPP